MGKAWGKSTTSISNQVVLAVITQLLLALFLSKHGMGGASDEKSIKKQAAREAGKDGGTDRPQWSEKVFRFTSRLSRQVLRFFSNCYTSESHQSSMKGSCGHCLNGIYSARPDTDTGTYPYIMFQ